MFTPELGIHAARWSMHCLGVANLFRNQPMRRGLELFIVWTGTPAVRFSLQKMTSLTPNFPKHFEPALSKKRIWRSCKENWLQRAESNLPSREILNAACAWQRVLPGNPQMR